MALNLTEGEVLQNRYRLISPLGKGGFSVVWLVEDTYTSSEVALKIFAPDKGLDQSGLAQFQKEYTRTRGLRHPHLLVPDHFDILREVNAPYLVMPYCPNGSLLERFENSSATEQDVALILTQIGSGLAELHKNRIIHQDIKPDNVLIGKEGQYMLTDFGISRQMRSTLNKATANQNYMTVAYSPPERYSANPVNTPASDIFSVGVMLFELCSGSVPWDGVGGMVLNTGAAIPNLPGQYSGRLNSIVQACMSREYEARPTAEQLMKFGQTFLEEQYWPEWTAKPAEEAPPVSPGGRKTQKMEEAETPPPPVPPVNRDAETDKDRTRRDGNRKPGSGGNQGSNRKVLVAAVVVPLVLAAGYFGYSAFGGVGPGPDDSPDIEVTSDTTAITQNLADSTAGSDDDDPVLEKKDDPVVDDDPDPITEKKSDPVVTVPPGTEEYRTARDYYIDGEFSQAFPLFRESVGSSHTPALSFLGRMYHYGEGTAENYDEALRYYNRAIQEGDQKAYYGLALLYLEGKGLPMDETTARNYFARGFDAIETAAEQGDYFWQFALGYLYQEGYGTAQDYSQAMSWYRKSAAQGYLEGIYRYGDMYFHGYGVSIDYTIAMDWIGRAAERGHHFSKVHMGDIHRIQNNYILSLQWYRQAAEEGDATAQNWVGLYYDRGDGVPENDATAVQWYRRAAENGLAVAQSNLGNMYRNGNGVTENDATAVAWYRKAAEQNYSTGQNYLGVMYQLGEGVEANDYTAVEWYRKAADNGLAVAQYNLGNMYKDGKGVTQNYSTAHEWFLKAYNQNYAGAANQIGLLYSNGNGVVENDATAVEWYRKAADLGLPVGYYNVGVMYQYGNGVTENLAEARRWYKLAEERGYSGATDKLNEIGRN